MTCNCKNVNSHWITYQKGAAAGCQCVITLPTPLTEKVTAYDMQCADYYDGKEVIAAIEAAGASYK